MTIKEGQYKSKFNIENKYNENEFEEDIKNITNLKINEIKANLPSESEILGARIEIIQKFLDSNKDKIIEKVKDIIMQDINEKKATYTYQN
ncbi:hypothetical protein HRbin34_00423 [bacterium HR34]|nr:hypothetical protein HRbin34_00423 [bacterium HR34]